MRSLEALESALLKGFPVERACSPLGSKRCLPEYPGRLHRQMSEEHLTTTTVRDDSDSDSDESPAKDFARRLPCAAPPLAEKTLLQQRRRKKRVVRRCRVASSSTTAEDAHQSQLLNNPSLHQSANLGSTNAEPSRTPRSSSSLNSAAASSCSAVGNNLFTDLPQDVVTQILSHLAPVFVVEACEPLCRGAFEASRTPLLWQGFLARDFPNLFQTCSRSNSIPWRAVYVRAISAAKYDDEPTEVKGLYLEMETALECLAATTTAPASPRLVGPRPDADEVPESSRPEPVAEKKRRRSSSETPPEHECSPTSCVFDPSPGGLFVCRATGTYHACSGPSPCSRAMPSDADPGSFVCPLSGRLTPRRLLGWKAIKRRVAAGLVGGESCEHFGDLFRPQRSSLHSYAAGIAEKAELGMVNFCAFAEPVESAMDEESTNGWLGFKGNCFMLGYECADEDEFTRHGPVTVGVPAHVSSTYRRPANAKKWPKGNLRQGGAVMSGTLLLADQNVSPRQPASSSPPPPTEERIRKRFDDEVSDARRFVFVSTPPSILSLPSIHDETSAQRPSYDRLTLEAAEAAEAAYEALTPTEPVVPAERKGTAATASSRDPGAAERSAPLAGHFRNLQGDLSAGSIRSTDDPKIGYSLLWVLLWATLMGFWLQRLAIRLGVVTGKDLATISRMEFPRYLSIIVWIATEVCLIGADVQAVIGAAVGLKLLTSLPITVGILVSLADSFLILLVDLAGTRQLEAIFAFFLLIMASCFLANMVTSGPDYRAVARGLVVPTVPNGTLPLGISLCGSVIMPHNLFLCSAVVLSREIDRSDSKAVARVARVYSIETLCLLLVSLVINTAVVVAFANPYIQLPKGEPLSLYNAHRALLSAIGQSSQWIWGLGLLSAGQCSTMACTYAGQFVMEGLLGLQIERLWIRATVTRLISIIPLVPIVYFDRATLETVANGVNLLQAFCLPFTLLLLMKFTASQRVMGTFALTTLSKSVAYITGALLVAANVALVVSQLGPTVPVFSILSGYFLMLSYIWQQEIFHEYYYHRGGGGGGGGRGGGGPFITSWIGHHQGSAAAEEATSSQSTSSSAAASPDVLEQ